ncbi:MAG: hypothetical protein AMS25_19275, partial [Gemmatimonas sp. SM23_52]
MSLYARVAVPRPLYRTFLYRVPDSLAPDIEPGRRVVVPFGRGELTGWVDKLVSEPAEIPSRTREILDSPDPEPVFDAELLELCRWVAHYYIAPLGLTFRAALPARLTAESAERLIRRPDAKIGAATPSEQALLAHLDQHKGAVKLSSVRRALGPGPWARVARKWAEAGLLTIEREAPSTTPPLRSRQVLQLTRELPSLQERDRIFRRAARQRELYEYLESVGGH